MQGFSWLAFWQFLPRKPSSGPLKIRRKGPELCIHNQTKINFIYVLLCILIYLWSKGQELSMFE